MGAIQAVAGAIQSDPIQTVASAIQTDPIQTVASGCVRRRRVVGADGESRTGDRPGPRTSQTVSRSPEISGSYLASWGPFRLVPS